MAISDIHGFYATFNELINKLDLNFDDQLFLLGDFVDRGKKGKEVLNKVLEMIDKWKNINSRSFKKAIGRNYG